MAVLARAGFTCVLAGTGPDGVRAVHQHRPILTTLDIGLPGVGAEELGPPDDPLYRYDGLRLLTLRGGRYFLLPEHWTVAGSSVLVLPDDSSVRLEYSR